MGKNRNVAYCLFGYQDVKSWKRQHIRNKYDCDMVIIGQTEHVTPSKKHSSLCLNLQITDFWPHTYSPSALFFLLTMLVSLDSH